MTAIQRTTSEWRCGTQTPRNIRVERKVRACVRQRPQTTVFGEVQARCTCLQTVSRVPFDNLLVPDRNTRVSKQHSRDRLR